ncbi:MAG: hypothetical protein C5B50_17555 [Verrucomicrobia bacterium]|nr:MAG: hypothetical protein C5B50_17555 [Verrucomicrobiota bacterium]
MRTRTNKTGAAERSNKVTFSATPSIINAIENLARNEGLENNRSAYLCVLINREYQRLFGARTGDDSDSHRASLNEPTPGTSEHVLNRIKELLDGVPKPRRQGPAKS